MICSKCGNQIADGSSFCPYCGAQVSAPAQPAQPAQNYAQPAQPYAQPAQPAQPYVQPGYVTPAPYQEDPQARELSKSILVFGILALAFACSFWLSFLGIVFGAIEGGKARAYAAAYQLTGRAKVGSILGKIGFILGIVMTAIFVIYIIALIAIGSSANYYYY